MLTKLTRAPTELGILPLSLLFDRSIADNFDSCPTADGIGPVKRLCDSRKYVRYCSFPIVEGIVPRIDVLVSDMADTLPKWQDTPLQVQTEDAGKLYLQDQPDEARLEPSKAAARSHIGESEDKLNE